MTTADSYNQITAPVVFFLCFFNQKRKSAEYLLGVNHALE